MGLFTTLEELLVATADAVRPPERLSVAEAAEKYRWLNNPGSYVGPFKNDKTPYMVGPQDVLQSLDHEAMIFVGPAQTGKTDSLLNWITHSVACDPADMMVIEKSQTAARDFARRRIAKLLRDTAAVRERVLPGRTNQSIYDYRFRSGMLLSLSWPTVNELSGKPVGRLWLTDYDRMPDDIDGEGSPFDLARKRATTFRRFGMTVAESSPGRVIDNPKWLPKSPHEAPPTTGILALYNRGDRRRWLWPCVNCDEYFEPDFANLRWPDSEDAMEAAEACWMECPHCAQRYRHDFDEKAGTPGKYMLNLRGLWLPDGMKALPGGRIVGTPRRTDTASFWLKGPAAAFTDWTQLVYRYLKAMEEYETTGDETALKTTINTDQGLPYTPQGMGAERLPEELRARARDLGDRVVPDGVRFLVAAVDVQKTRFEVQVMGVGEGGDVWIIDRFKIRKSDRIDEDGERYPVNPAQYPEDWHVLIDGVILKSYPLGDGSGRHMQIKAVGIDSGGRAGVTVNAYDFWRFLQRTDGRGLHRRVRLVKGDPRPAAPLVRIDYPDAERKDRKAAARGEIPILFIASNKMKDAANAMLGRKEPGGGMVSFPLWLEDWFYAEMTAETRTAKGWVNPKAYRNEAWDLFNYGLGLCYSKLIRLDLIDWSNPPGWAAEWDENDLVSGDFNKRFEGQPKAEYDLAQLANTLA